MLQQWGCFWLALVEETRGKLRWKQGFCGMRLLCVRILGVSSLLLHGPSHIGSMTDLISHFATVIVGGMCPFTVEWGALTTTLNKAGIICRELLWGWLLQELEVKNINSALHYCYDAFCVHKIEGQYPMKSLRQHTAAPVGAGEMFQVANDLYCTTQILITNLRYTYTVWVFVMLHTA